VGAALAADPGRAILGGTLTATAPKGVAILLGLTLDRPGVGYILALSRGD
jgi:hypothetical protein